MSTVRSILTRAAVATAIAGAAAMVSAVPANAATPLTAGATTTASGGHWGAIAISPRTGRTGYSYDYATSAAAASAAVHSCGASDCQAAVEVSNGCAAAAQASNRAWGWAYAASRVAAQNAALRATKGSGARIITWVCTTGHQ